MDVLVDVKVRTDAKWEGPGRSNHTRMVSVQGGDGPNSALRDPLEEEDSSEERG